ncbi:unnamed protein product [Arctia plantaginis]|uniref:Uncharacterized protein n=1 Tax=Arctia plantaginis TaxID=874455 RepID=A0A8S1ALY6_ARCPL|nr:unnamed protein product [Arctia plantaginis]CAB3248851.1 unnamed protein product [Arctia plantaginis]
MVEPLFDGQSKTACDITTKATRIETSNEYVINATTSSRRPADAGRAKAPMVRPAGGPGRGTSNHFTRRLPLRAKCPCVRNPARRASAGPGVKICTKCNH